MRVRIFSCHHAVPARPLSTPLFQTLVSGIRPPERSAWTDLDGENIADDNAFAELRHQYFVWRNLLGDYDRVGFEHYRRPFLLFAHPLPWLQAHAPRVAALARLVQSEPARWGHNDDAQALGAYLEYRAGLGEAEQEGLRGVLGRSDILCTTPLITTPGIGRQYAAYHGQARWEAFVAQIRAHPFFAAPRCPPETEFRALPCLNMYVMRADLFDAYMRLHFEILQPLRDSGVAGEGRWLGFLSERLFAIWLRAKMRHEPGLRVGTLPFLVGAGKLPELAPHASAA